MIKFTCITDPRLTSLPPPAHFIVVAHLATLRSICKRPPHHEEEGFVGFVEAQDTPEVLESAIGRSLLQLEGVFREGDCLVGVALWGNAGEGITLVLPEIAGHAPQVVELLIETYLEKGEKR